MNLRKIGAHVSIAGGHTQALRKLHEMSGNCLQIFSSSPRQWINPKITGEQITEFLRIKKEFSIDPIYFHASYLVNLADAGALGERSVHSISTDMQLAAKMDVKGVIIHLGSFKEDRSKERFQILITNCKKVLAESPPEILFIIENAGSRKIGTDMHEIARIIAELNDARVRVCLDTCHTFVAGYDFTTTEKLDILLHQFDELIGITKLELFHANDTKDSFHSFRDRHENIGKGTLGLSTFQLLLNHPVTMHLPFILEVPGKDKSGPDAENVAILNSLIQ